MATTSVRPPPVEVVGRQSVRDPDTWLVLVATLAALLSTLQIFLYPIGRSQAEFAVSGRELILGGAPAQTYWTLRAPGIAVVNALVQLTVGSSAMAIRLAEVVTLLVFALFSARLVKRIVGFERVGILAACLALFVHAQLEYEYTGQPEIYASTLITVATWLTLRVPTRHDRFLQFSLIGLLIGAVALFVPLFWFVLLPLAIYSWRSERTEREGLAPLWALLTMVGTSLVVPLLLVLWLAKKHALGVFVSDWIVPQLKLYVSWSFDGFVEWLYYVTDRLLLRMSAILPAGCLVAFTLSALHRDESKGVRLLLQIVIVMVLAFGFSGESNPGRLSGALPFLAMIAAIGIYKLYRRLILQGSSAIAAFWSGLVLLAALCTAVGVAPGSYFWRSLIRLKFMARVMPYHAIELLEGDLYNNAQVNLSAVRRVQHVLSQNPDKAKCFIQGDEPQLLWSLRMRPQARLIRPLPDDLAIAVPELDAKMSDAIDRLNPRCFVISPWAAAQAPGSLATRLGASRDQVAEHSRLTHVVDGFGIWGPKENIRAMP